MTMPLTGVRILDLTRILAGPLCTQTLADMGADVLKVENPKGGDELRHMARPAVFGDDGEALPGQGVDFVSINRNKRSLAVDLRTAEGQDIVRRLAAGSDILVENYKVGDLKRYGLDYESLRAVNPRLVYCSITGYGQTGAMAAQPGFDSVFQAMCGLMSLTGEAGGDPQRISAPVIDYATGQAATTAILAALWHVRVNGGPGQHIDIALFDCGVSALTVRTQLYLSLGEVPTRIGNRLPGTALGRLVITSDGFMTISAFRDPDFIRLSKVLGRPDLPSDPRFASKDSRFENEAALDAIIDPIFAADTTASWLGRLQAEGIIAAPVHDVRQALECDHAQERGIVRHAPRPDGITVPYVATPMRFSETPIGVGLAPPDLGRHTSEVLRERLGVDEAQLAAWREAGAIGGT